MYTFGMLDAHTGLSCCSRQRKYRRHARRPGVVPAAVANPALDGEPEALNLNKPDINTVNRTVSQASVAAAAAAGGPPRAAPHHPAPTLGSSLLRLPRNGIMTAEMMRSIPGAQPSEQEPYSVLSRVAYQGVPGGCSAAVLLDGLRLAHRDYIQSHSKVYHTQRVVLCKATWYPPFRPTLPPTACVVVRTAPVAGGGWPQPHRTAPDELALGPITLPFASINRRPSPPATTRNATATATATPYHHSHPTPHHSSRHPTGPFPPRRCLQRECRTKGLPLLGAPSL